MADTTIGTSVAIATPDLEIIEGQITTTSLQIAEHFGKRHTHVLRAIRNLLAELPENARPNFGLSEFTDDTGRKLPAYRITRDGFTLLAMGFTGKEAMQWKVAYLTAFNKMEAELQQAAWEGFKKVHPGLSDDELITKGFIKPRRARVFCASLADVFDNAVDPQWRADLFGLIMKTPHLDWLLLTKRIGNVKHMLAELTHGNDPDLSLLDMMPLPNVWIGATIVNQEEADRDIPKLLQVPAKVRFLSMEPLLGPVNLAPYLYNIHLDNGEQPVDWVIVGGESGPGARPMHPDWARSLRDQCFHEGAPFLFKQWGEWMPGEKNGDTWKLTFPIDGPHGPANPEFHDWPDGTCSARVGKKAASRLLDSRTWDEFPNS